MSFTISDLVVETLERAGVRLVYGLSGDSLNGLTDAVRRSGGLAWEHVRHEQAAAFAGRGRGGDRGRAGGPCSELRSREPARHAIQHTYYQGVTPGIETTAWYEESGAVLHDTWLLETHTTRRFAALPSWLAEDIGTAYAGDNQGPGFVENIETLRSQRQDWPRRILSDDGYFVVL
jgi:Thiamine pyrophosphate enzyme, N-terminal TPP binding domain